jgi:hypothetical protein
MLKFFWSFGLLADNSINELFEKADDEGFEKDKDP